MMRVAGPSPMRKVKHTVENFTLCSSAQHACSPLLQYFLHEVELGKVASHLSFFRWTCCTPVSSIPEMLGYAMDYSLDDLITSALKAGQSTPDCEAIVNTV